MDGRGESTTVTAPVPELPLPLSQRSGPARRSQCPLSTGAGTFVGWWAPKDDQIVSHSQRSAAWAEGGGMAARCQEQSEGMRRAAGFGWRGGDGIGPTTMTLAGSLGGMQRRSRADFLNVHP